MILYFYANIWALGDRIHAFHGCAYFSSESWLPGQENKPFRAKGLTGQVIKC